MLGRLIGVILAMTMVSVISHGQAWAVTTGTADGTYDFGSLGASDSAGTGWSRLGDKFKVGNHPPCRQTSPCGCTLFCVVLT